MEESIIDFFFLGFVATQRASRARKQTGGGAVIRKIDM